MTTKPKKRKRKGHSMVDLRPCVGVKSYFVDNAGNVYRKLNPGVGNHGYRRVMIRVGTVRKYFMVHRLVLDAFSVKKGQSLVTRHLNGDRLDNRISNLRFGTIAENNMDTVKHGRHQHREMHHNSKLKESYVSEIRKLLKDGISIASISRDFGVSHGCISDINKNRTWRSA